MSMTQRLNEAGEIRGYDLVGETVTLAENECRGLIACTFLSGTLRLAQSKGAVSILLTTVKDSDVVAAKRQKDYPLFQARFVNCKFHGLFSGVSFGRTDRSELREDFGDVEGCDFTEATLNGCRFFNVEVSTLRLPAWPHVVLHDFAKRAQNVAAMTWPGELGRYMRICADQPASVKASVIYVPSFAKLVACTEEQVREAFDKFGGLQM
jgi:hypothetical protein